MDQESSSNPRRQLNLSLQPPSSERKAPSHKPLTNFPTSQVRFKQENQGKLQFSPNEIYDFTSEDLLDLGEIGRGSFGSVNKMIFKKTDKTIAVKRIRCSSVVDEKEQKRIMDLDVVMKTNDCDFIVQFYGSIFKEGDCWIAMEIMDQSLDKFYRYVYDYQHERIPENILGQISVATLHALNYLKEKLKIIHRDVKPSNILVHEKGHIKLCDFGISGQLIDSIAKTKDAGCRPYMAPERIDPEFSHKGYDVRSDVWSLGITIMEIATGKFPYQCKWASVFEQLYQVVQGPAPRLTPSYNGFDFSEDFCNFVNTCLIKEETNRPKYKILLQHPFIQLHEKLRPYSHPSPEVANYIATVLESMKSNGFTQFTTDQQEEIEF